MTRKICHITTIHPWDDTRIFQKECVTAAQSGYDVTFLVGNGPTKTEKGVRIIGVPWKAAGRLVRFKVAGKALYRKALQTDADIFHFHDPEFLPYARKLIRRGKKVVYDVHEDVPRQLLAKHYIPKPLRKLISARFERLENKVVASLSGLLTATTHIRDRFLPINQNTSELRNFPSLEELGEPVEFSTKPNEICYVGRVTEIRGAKEMVDAMDGLSTTLNLAGNFSPESLKGELMKRPGWKNVRSYGFVERPEVKKILDRSRAGLVCLHPTINYVDALPVKMFEYMAAGIPVVSSDIPLWKEIVDDARCGLCVDPLDPLQIREAIRQLLDNPERSAEMGRFGRKAVEEKYNWAAENEKMFQLYDQILSE